MSPRAQTRREAGVALRARFFAFSMQASATAHRERTYGSVLASPEIIKNARDKLGRFLWLDRSFLKITFSEQEDDPEVDIQETQQLLKSEDKEIKS